MARNQQPRVSQCDRSADALNLLGEMAPHRGIPGSRKIDAFTGEPTERPMKAFHKADRKDFDTTPLNGVRPVDKDTVGRWATKEHAARIQQILREVPDFPQILVELGYEKDDEWVTRWKAAAGGAPISQSVI